MVNCPYCGKPLEETGGLYKCNNPDCIINFNVIQRPATLEDLTRWAELARNTYPKYAVGGGKVHYNEDGGSEAVHRDIKAVQAARDAIIPRDEWNELSKKAKQGDKEAREKQRKTYALVKMMLENPGFFEKMKDDRFENVKESLGSSGFSFGEALAGSHLALKGNIYTKSLGNLRKGWRDRLSVFRKKTEKQAPDPEKKPIKGSTPKPKDFVCPICSKLYKGNFPLEKVPNTDTYHCSSCGNAFIIDARGHLVPILPHTSVDMVTESCPVCKSPLEVKHFDINGIKVHRIECTNPNCRGHNALQPWYIDLNEADYNQWVELRKKRLLERLGQLENDRLSAAKNKYEKNGVKQEIERMKKNILSFGTTDINYQALGLIDRKLDSTNPLKRKEYMQKYQNAAQTVESSYGFSKEDAERMGVDAKNFESIKKKVAEKHSEDAYTEKSYNTLHGKSIGYVTRISEYSSKIGFNAVLVLIGLVAGFAFGWQFLVAATLWAVRNVIPEPKPIEMHSDFELLGGGSLFANQQNKYSSALAFTKSILKLGILIFMGWGFFSTQLPFRGLMLLIFFFAAYFSLPGEYSPQEPQKFMEGMLRPVVAVILAFVVFRGIFQSWELASLCLAFFFVFPLPTEKKNLAMAIGRGLSGATATYENIDKIIFVGLMIWGLVAVMGGSGLNIDLGTIAGNIFFPFWVVALIGGLVSPASTRPHTGVIMLLLVFIFFSAGPGEQIVGQGFFGAWWPTVHNTMSSFMEPITQGFSALGGTFSNTFMLLTNPVGYAKNIMEGTYEKNPTGLTGAYGVELENVVIPAIYPGTDAMATLTVKNVGPVNAENVIVSLELPDELAPVLPLRPQYYSGFVDSNDPGFVEEFRSMAPSSAVPLFFSINAYDCRSINDLQSKLSRLTLRNEYISINATVEYDYSVDSWMPVELISEQEWKERTAKNTFMTTKVPSHISTSPVKLSIGSFEQPIVAGGGRPFYVGLNATSEEGPNSDILWVWQDENGQPKEGSMTLELPKEIADRLTCTPVPKGVPPALGHGDVQQNKVLVWTGEQLEENKGRAIYCTATSLDTLRDDTGRYVPSKTFYVRAHADFRFRKWDSKDTLFAFDDVCTNVPALEDSDQSS